MVPETGVKSDLAFCLGPLMEKTSKTWFYKSLPQYKVTGEEMIKNQVKVVFNLLKLLDLLMQCNMLKLPILMNYVEWFNWLQLLILHNIA